MNNSPGTSEQEPLRTDLSSCIRSTLRELDDLDHETAGYLNSLAFILQRVAAADEHISSEEVDRMESILIEHADLSPPQAVLAVEIAKHRRQLADCCCTYRASRKLRTSLDRESRRRLYRFLDSVAEADGLVHPTEQAEIRQIAAELGVTTD